MKLRTIAHVASAALLTATSLTAVLLAGAPAQADTTICEKYGITTIAGGRYVVNNNNWGDDTTQCINVTSTGFAITTASHNRPTNGAPGSYPSIFYGCHYTNCSAGSGLPVRADTSAFSALNTSVSMTYPGSGVWDAAYDIWFDPTPRTDGQNTGAEIMVWLNHQGSIQPVGSKVGTASIAGASWDVWFGNIGWNVISYVRTAATNSLNFNVNAFLTDSISRGYAQRSWYLTSIQAGFEPWVGQTGLVVNSFSVTSGGGGGDTTPPSTPGNLTASGTSSSGTSLSWSGSSDNTGVSGYDVFRAPGSSGGTFTQVGSATGTSFAATGLSASSAYRFYVRARDAAGNTSGNSNTVTVTTTSGGGGGGGGCTAVIVPQSPWSNGYTANVNVTNTGSSATSTWTVTFTLPSGHSITGSWGAAVTVSGQTVTARNLSYNGALSPGASTQWGFQASRTGSALPGSATCTG